MKIVEDAFLEADRTQLLRLFPMKLHPEIWREAFDAIISNGKCKRPTAMHSLFIEFGHRIRESVLDDQLVVHMLRTALPPSTAESAQLYRGENIDRFLTGRVGFCWTTQRNVAERFGRGLNAMVGDGGLLLSAWAPTNAIVAQPNDHSRWLNEDEYIVDITLLRNFEVVARYPKI